ncbi:MAG: class I SAM-dependent methyltransferase [Spirochaetia bacterium]|jgi:SAM-dependent methyltransferase|nr:class I SAM-dependent methyltransferase [Spirochaetia bacterium]
MDDTYQDINNNTISHWIAEGWKWGIPVSHETYLQAKDKDVWDILLTPTKPVPRSWFPSLKGKKVLGLASGGGQQIPILTARGAICTVLDYCSSQLEAETSVSKRENYTVTLVQADMSKPLPFADGSFDMIINPVSNCYIREILPLWKECSRILVPGGLLLAGFDTNINYIVDEQEERIIRGLPFDPLQDKGLYEESMKKNWGIQFSHSLEEQLKGQLDAGLVIEDLYEDINDEGRLGELKIPTFMATKARKPLI